VAGLDFYVTRHHLLVEEEHLVIGAILVEVRDVLWAFATTSPWIRKS
jgi:hypothetical protein